MSMTQQQARNSAQATWRANASALAQELWRDKTGLVSLIILVGIVAMALFAPLIAPFDPAAQSLSHRLTPPAWLDRGVWTHPLGTDHLGRDILSRIIWGARLTLLIGSCVVLFGGALGTAVGLWAGYNGGRTDNILMRIVDIQVSFPGILLILLIVSVMGTSVVTLIVVLSLTNWMVFARFVRGTVMSLRQSAYVEAAEIVGCHPARILFRHILPNLITPLLVLSILEFTNIVLAEAALSFLGLGIQPPATSWGLDIASGRDYIYIAWWLVTFPGICIVSLVLSLNLFSSWVRITTDPQEREKRFAHSYMSRRGKRS
ncbi:ABC transporter permease [Rhodobacteraceae bacterium F11138]|nr:ABC transporter permease [Rhodobacteraceae bacterium F11138]